MNSLEKLVITSKAWWTFWQTSTEINGLYCFVTNRVLSFLKRTDSSFFERTIWLRRDSREYYNDDEFLRILDLVKLMSFVLWFVTIERYWTLNRPYWVLVYQIVLPIRPHKELNKQVIESLTKDLLGRMCAWAIPTLSSLIPTKDGTWHIWVDNRAIKNHCQA